MTLKELLIGLGTGKIKPKDHANGICGNVTITLNQEHDFPIQIMATKWPHYSGNIVFPVPATNKRYTPYEQYMCGQRLWSGKQGKLRKDLCLFLAANIKE